jgi:hypothetical protein
MGNSHSNLVRGESGKPDSTSGHEFLRRLNLKEGSTGYRKGGNIPGDKVGSRTGVKTWKPDSVGRTIRISVRVAEPVGLTACRCRPAERRDYPVRGSNPSKRKSRGCQSGENRAGMNGE